MRRMRMMAAVVAVLGSLLAMPAEPAFAAPPQATFAYALTTTNRLLLFNVNTPGNILRNVPISGLQGADQLFGIDVRPATGALYGLGTSGIVYVINPVTGAAVSAVQAGFTTGGGIEGFGMDFNPVVDLVRAVGEGGGNLRVNPTTGAVLADSFLSYAGTDPHVGITPRISALGYTNNFVGATQTTLYDIDTTLDILAIQDPPNAGTLQTVGALGISAVSPVGLDIVTVGGVNTAYASLNTGAASTGFYTINLSNGAATLAGTIGGGATVRDIAIATAEAVCTVPVGTPGVIFAAPGAAATFGTEGPDVICGTAGADMIAGLGGDDLILGLGGNDKLGGGGANDTMYGGDGEDQLAGAEGEDILIGGAGNDDISGANGNDTLLGNVGTDRLLGGDGTDLCNAGGNVGDLVLFCEP
jgi:Ca2+-binding RTX toxin-like protein